MRSWWLAYITQNLVKLELWKMSPLFHSCIREVGCSMKVGLQQVLLCERREEKDIVYFRVSRNRSHCFHTACYPLKLFTAGHFFPKRGVWVTEADPLWLPLIFRIVHHSRFRAKNGCLGHSMTVSSHVVITPG